MKEAVNDLLDVIRLEQLEQNLFRGATRDTRQRGIFGGLVAGQALMAASCTVEAERAAHSLHAYFLRPGDFSLPIIYEVDRIRDGNSFTTRRVTAIQHGRPIFCLEASFQVEEAGIEHQTSMPAVPLPDELEDDQTLRARLAPQVPESIRDAFLQVRPVEFRPVRPAAVFNMAPQEPARQVWFRVPGDYQADAAMHRALLAYCSDYGLLGTSMLPHGLNFFQPNVMSASIDHAMWFHRPFKVNEWLLYDMQSPSASSARGFNLGSIYRADGVLVASVAQEGLVRVKPPANPV